VNGAEKETQAKHEETTQIAVVSPQEERAHFQKAQGQWMKRYVGTILDWV
jgi:hypothetical protein